MALCYTTRQWPEVNQLTAFMSARTIDETLLSVLTPVLARLVA